MTSRIVLINSTKSPSRDELSNQERAYGDLILAGLGLEWGGYEIVPNLGKKAGRWMVPDDKWNECLDFVETYQFEGYELRLIAQVDTPKGPECRRFA